MRVLLLAHMRALFWRIFALFWITTASFLVLVLWYNAWLFENEEIAGLGITREQASLDERLRGAAFAINEPGLDKLRDLVKGARDGGIALYVIDAANHNDILGQKLPDDVEATLSRASQDGLGLHTTRRRLLPFVRADGQKLIGVDEYADAPLKRMLYRRPSLLWKQIGMAGALSAIASLLLAIYICEPLARFRFAARRIADGDFNARVGTMSFSRSVELRALAREFDQMATRLQDLVEGQRRLIRDVSHEMRSPLARQRIAIELARDQAGDETRAQLDRIERESERLEEMIAQAIQLSRMETTTPSKTERIALDALVASLAEDASFEAQARHCSLLLQVQQGAPPQVTVETDLVASAIENVVRNAICYTQPYSAIRIMLDRADNWARLRVADAGPGVPETDTERIFEPYFRTDEARQRKSGGSGLGLAIARRAIERQGGSIRASNIAGGGLEVEIRLPLAPA